MNKELPGILLNISLGPSLVDEIRILELGINYNNFAIT